MACVGGFGTPGPDARRSLLQPHCSPMARRFIEYRGVRIPEDWPEEIRAAQLESYVWVRGRAVRRIPFGSEPEDWGADRHPCGDCAVVKGELHVPGCDVEVCPVCGWQLITCSCGVEFESDFSD